MKNSFRIQLSFKMFPSLPGYRLDPGTPIYICIDPDKEIAEVSNDNYRIRTKYPKEGKPLNVDATILLTAAIRIKGDAYAAYQAVKSLL